MIRKNEQKSRRNGQEKWQEEYVDFMESGETRLEERKRKLRKLRRRQEYMMYGRWLLFGLCILLGAGALISCSGKLTDQVKVVLTTGFDKDEVFRIEGISCHLPELMVYLTNTQNQYENVYGAEIWKASVDGVTLEQNVKDTTLARIAQIKTMNLLAGVHAVTLTEEEEQKAGEAARAYLESLNDKEKELLGVTEDLLHNLYGEYALANKVYHYIIKDINPEISDDEARTIRVQQIFLKTYTLDGNGSRIENTETARQEVRQLAAEILTRAQQGEDFEVLMEEYSGYTTGTLAFGKGDVDPLLEEAAFQLGNEECTLVETADGYCVMKCISTFDKEETDANKIKIMEERKKEVFGQEYDTFISTLTRKQNTELWEKVELIQDESVTTADFFDIYHQYFETEG